MNQKICLKHKRKAILICQNFICTENRFICSKCIQETNHNQHREDLLDLDEMLQNIQLQQTLFKQQFTQIQKQVDLCKQVKEQHEFEIDKINEMEGLIFNNYIQNTYFNQKAIEQQYLLIQQYLQNQSENNDSQFKLLFQAYDKEQSIQNQLLNDNNKNFDQKEQNRKQNGNCRDYQNLQFKSKQYYDEGCKLRKLNLYISALEMFDKSLSSNKENTDSLKRKGDCLFNLKLYKQAIQVYDQFLQQYSMCTYIVIEKGLFLFNLKKYEKAIPFYDLVIFYDNQNLKALCNKGQQHVQNNLNISQLKMNLSLYNEAIQYCNLVLQIDSQNTDSLCCKGYCLMNLGKYNEAIEYCDLALQIDLANTDALNYKGMSLTNLERFSEAIEFFKEVLSLDSKNPVALHYKGECLRKQCKLTKALKYFEYGLQVSPKSYGCLIGKGLCLLGKGDYDKQQQCFEQFKILEPSSISEKLLYYDKSLEIFPDNYLALGHKGVLLVKQEKKGEAKKCLQASMELNPYYNQFTTIYQRLCTETIE